MKHKTEVYILDCRELKDAAVYERLFAEQDESRKEKILLCRDEGESRLSLGGGCLIRYGLKLWGIPGDDLVFGENGAPAVKSGGVHLSLSHSGDYAMLGISTKALGVDIERMQPEAMHLAEHFFTEGEKHSMHSASSPMEEFFRIWSRKECFIKREGLRDLREIDTLSPVDGAQFYDFTLDGYSCVCYCAEDVPPQLIMADISEII